MNDSDTIAEFLEQLAARRSTPGGGAVAALSAAQGCALISMVCRFTKGDRLNDALEHAESARRRFLELGAADVECFNAVMAVWKQGGDQLQQALKGAAEVPMELAETAAELTIRIAQLEKDGNRNLVTDTGIAAQQLLAAIDAAQLNVLVNLKGVEDKDWQAQMRSRLEELSAPRDELQKIADRVAGKLST